jgi:hypothetical protein
MEAHLVIAEFYISVHMTDFRLLSGHSECRPEIRDFINYKNLMFIDTHLLTHSIL